MWINDLEVHEKFKMLFQDSYEDNAYYLREMNFADQLRVSFISPALPANCPQKWISKGFNSFTFDIFFDAVSLKLLRKEQHKNDVYFITPSLLIENGFYISEITFASCVMLNLQGGYISTDDFNLHYMISEK